MNSMEVKDKLKHISKTRNVDFNVIYRFYMYDRFIERLSNSKYRDNFILKGGFYLSTLFGVESRTTMDIDASIKYTNFTDENISSMIKEIINIDLNDGVEIDYEKIEQIRNEDEYGGYRITLIAKQENVRQSFHLDIATGDPITPGEIIYKYKPLLSNNPINLWAYNVETVLAEKLETILNRVELNGRMRDFYDIYLICTRYWDILNKIDLKKAIENTFRKRTYNGDPLMALEIIKNSDTLYLRWNKYREKYDFAKNIEYKDIIIYIKQIINELVPVAV